MATTFTSLEEVIAAAQKAKNGSATRTGVPMELFQKRLQLRDPGTVRPIEAYAEQMRDGQEFPPVLAFLDPDTKALLLADGNSRLEAAESLGLTTFTVEFRLGDRRAATLAAAQVNTQHGLCASLADRKTAGRALLRDGEWAGWSNRHLGRIVGLSGPTIETLREELEAGNQASATPAARRYLRGGKVHTAKVKAKATQSQDRIRRIVDRVRKDARQMEAAARSQLLGALQEALQSESIEG